jgi:hypothetical protein
LCRPEIRRIGGTGFVKLFPQQKPLAMELKPGDYFKLSRQMKESLRTRYNFGRVDDIMTRTIEATLVDENEVPSDEFAMVDDGLKGKVFSFRLNEIID